MGFLDARNNDNTQVTGFIQSRENAEPREEDRLTVPQENAEPQEEDRMTVLNREIADYESLTQRLDASRHERNVIEREALIKAQQ